MVEGRIRYDYFRQDVASLPGVSRWGVGSLITYLETVVANGLRSVLLFGVPEKVRKEEDGRTGETEDNPVMEAVRRIKSKFPDLTVACDVCLCPFTSHGHCGVLYPGTLVCCTHVLWCVVPTQELSWCVVLMYFGMLYPGK